MTIAAVAKEKENSLYLEWIIVETINTDDT